MELRTLRYLIAVVEAGSLTAAAENLRLSQPSLSVAISKLETELGVPLLVRSPRGVEPTSAGRYLLDAAARILGDVDELTRTLQRYGAGIAGTVTLAAVPVLMWHRVPELLRAHAQSAPEVTVQVVDPPPWAALDMLQQGRVDLAAVIVADPQRFAQRHQDQFDIIDWGPAPLVGVRPLDRDAPEHEEAPETHTEEPLPLHWFDGASVLMPQRTAAVPSLPEAIDTAFQEHGIVPSQVRTVETIQNSVALIEAGLGSAILPDPDRQSLRRFRVRVQSLEPPLPPLRALVLVRTGATRDAVLAHLLTRIARHEQV